jgi:hypothetical protein
MMRYYELFDDVAVPKRWHLGDVTLPDGTEPAFLDGVHFDRAGPLSAVETRPGRVIDFSLTSFAVPVATHQLAEVVASVAGPDVQCIPVNVANQRDMVVLNSVRVIRCLDERSSEFIKWTKRDHRADLAGQYRQVTKLVLDPTAIPANAHFFRIEGWVVALIVSEAVKDAMEAAGCVGAKFFDVMPTKIRRLHS